jgi:hypothetical protein
MEIKRIRNKNKGEYPRFFLSVDGVIDEKSRIDHEENYVFISNKELVSKVKTLSFMRLKNEFNAITFFLNPSWCEWKFLVKIIFEKISYYPNYLVPPVITFEPSFDYTQWNKFYSIEEVEQAYSSFIVPDNNISFHKSEKYMLGNFSLAFSILDLKEIAGLTVDQSLAYAKGIHEQAIASLTQNIKSDLITTLFEFPEELKTSCKQYLMYFGQFLADLGINANTSIKEDANRVLFTVMPDDGSEALEKIKEALDIFLNAPENISFESQDNTVRKDIAVIQWEANVHHLKGQLALAQALVETKNATIEALKLSNYQLQQASTPTIHLQASDNREEKIMGGLVSLKKYEGKGFSVDVAELFRRLKRKINF